MTLGTLSAQWERSSENVHTPLLEAPDIFVSQEIEKRVTEVVWECTHNLLFEAPDIFVRYKIEKRWCENVHTPLFEASLSRKKKRDWQRWCENVHTPAAWGLHHIHSRPVRRHDGCQNLKKIQTYGRGVPGQLEDMVTLWGNAIQQLWSDSTLWGED